uniref:Uncharacterized protein n=1 Tax=Leersia perrieri TaxID=77586 RepID=A0A0D9W3D9_9ORYZ
MATTPTTTAPFAARLHAPAAAAAARASFSTLCPPSLPRGRLALASASSNGAGAAENKGQQEKQRDEQEASEEEEATGRGEEKTPEAVAAELKEVLRARKEAEAAAADGGGWWSGVAQEMGEIEWPSPGKVVGTTGVVLGVIAGSTAALLSVNALLAELSDRVFAGRGLQDFF